MRKCFLGWAPCRAWVQFIEMSYNCSLNQRWYIVLSGAVRQLQLNCVCATVSNPEPTKPSPFFRKPAWPQIWPSWPTETCRLYLDEHIKLILDSYLHTDNSHLSICRGLEALGRSTLIWVGGERGPQAQSGHIRTLPSKLLFQLAGSEPQEAISAWQGRQNQRQSGEETHTEQKTHSNHNRAVLHPALTREGSSADHTQAARLWV